MFAGVSTTLTADSEPFSAPYHALQSFVEYIKRAVEAVEHGTVAQVASQAAAAAQTEADGLGQEVRPEVLAAAARAEIAAAEAAQLVKDLKAAQMSEAQAAEAASEAEAESAVSFRRTSARMEPVRTLELNSIRYLLFLQVPVE